MIDFIFKFPKINYYIKRSLFSQPLAKELCCE